MKTNKKVKGNPQIIKGCLDIVWFVIIFYFIQLLFQACASLAYTLHAGSFTARLFLDNLVHVAYSGKWLAAISVASSLVNIAVFTRLRWTPVSNSYLLSRPWISLIWVAILSLGTILPAEWIYEQLQISMPESYEQLFEGVMSEPWGYLAIGVLAPVAEEVVFRGAILRVLLRLFSHKWHWAAIALSAIVFGLVHGNAAQGIHAFIIGLLLGWMFYRTDSIVPGIVMHWVNNSVAYVMYNIMPDMADGKLIDLFHGSQKMMVGGLFFSFCILIPALFQLAIRLKKAE